MTSSMIEQRRQEIIKTHGEWQGENIQLSGDIYTRGKDADVNPYRLQRLVQMVADVCGSFEGLRVLDLGCLEGAHSIEFAMRGSQVVGIEGRDSNLAKARFAQEVLGLTNVEFVKDDVRNLSVDRYGQFDVVLCSGILYHLDAPDVFTFLEAVAAATRRCAVIDTHISLSPTAKVTFGGKDYYGSPFTEFERKPSREEEERAAGASIENLKSFWLTRPSLYNFISSAGFTSLYECHVPEIVTMPKDRVTLLAIKGRREELLCSPIARDYPRLPYGEEGPEQGNHRQVPAWKRLLRRSRNRLRRSA